MLFWGFVGVCVIRYPKKGGVIVAILALGSVAIQLYFLRSHLANLVAETGHLVSPKLWVRFWLSVSPLILGGLFALASFRAAEGQMGF